jgi:hypothetical protein
LTKKLLLSSKLYTRAMAAGIMQNKVRWNKLPVTHFFTHKELLSQLE